jgi:segregation and condensation protein A
MSHHRVPITIRLESFEGPLDLLLYLIQSHEMDISKIAITRITDQYLAYVRLMEELDFDIASEFLVMAATLIYWKSKAILPREGDEQAANEEEEFGLTPEELIRQLMEHKRFLAAGDDLAQLPQLNDSVFTRPNLKPPIEKVWREMNVTDLAMGMQDILVREKRRKKVLRKETVSVAEKIQEFALKLTPGKMTEFTALLEDITHRPEVVATFLASLELSRLKKMKIYQQLVYDPIYLELLEKLGSLDLKLAETFEKIEQGAPV